MMKVVIATHNKDKLKELKTGLNQLNIDVLRNKILLKVLPLKV